MSKWDNDHFEWLELRVEELMMDADEEGSDLTYDQAWEQAREDLMRV